MRGLWGAHVCGNFDGFQRSIPSPAVDSGRRVEYESAKREFLENPVTYSLDHIDRIAEQND